MTKRVLSNEDWYPTLAFEHHDDGRPTDYYPGMIQVSFYHYEDGHARVCVWGGDDFGMEQEFQPGDNLRAEREFDRIVNLTTRAELEARGFGQA